MPPRCQSVVSLSKTGQRPMLISSYSALFFKNRELGIFWKREKCRLGILWVEGQSKTSQLLWTSCFMLLKAVSLLQESSSSWLDSVLCHMADIILLEDTPSIQMEVAILVKEFPDIRWVLAKWTELESFSSMKHHWSHYMLSFSFIILPAHSQCSLR